jgi:UTP--glucose-1-phosphate uridylyltransferase
MGGMKGIIVAAGYGTRFLPVTRTVPKEMLPLIDKPSIAFVVDEFIASGIEDIIIITSRRKKVLDDYFDRDVELESVFIREGRADKLALAAPPKARFSFVRQTEMRGTGHALLQAAPLLGGQPCVVAYPDDLHFGWSGGPAGQIGSLPDGSPISSPSILPLAGQLMAVHQKTGCSVLATCHEPGDVSRYGVIDPDPDGIHVRGFVEKPAPGAEPSHEISIGRYLYTPEFFEILAEGWAKHEKGEYYHMYGIDRLIEKGKMAWSPVQGQRLDTGEPAGYLEAILTYARTKPELKAVLDRAGVSSGV